MSRNQWLGQILGGRYTIDDLLGQGGMSSVFRATDPNLKRTVAVKVIHPHLSDNEEFVRRFESEAASVASLRHPNIIQVFDFNHDGGMYYMVMEYIAGESLLERIRRLNAAGRTLPYQETVRYAIQVCEAVDYAHKRSMIHRDIKPANIMLDLSGQAILMDFGIAKIIGGQQHTATGAVVGTALYMSPEQIRGERFDHRTDIYSIGVTLFEMVDGRPPYESDSTMSLMMKHLNDPVPDLRQLRPEVPPALVDVIEKAMSKDPAERFQSAAEMAAGLRRTLAGMQGHSAAGAGSDERVQVFASTAPLEAARSMGASRAAAPASGASIFPPRTGTGPTRSAPPAAPGRRNGLLAGGCAVILLAIVCTFGGGAVLLNQVMGARPDIPATQMVFAATQTAVFATRAALATAAAPAPATPDAPVAVINPATPTPASSPNPQPSPTLDPNLPTPLPAGFPFVLLVSAVQEGDHYKVVYETVNFIEALGARHIHFYYNNITQKDASASGGGAFMMHAGPRPFTGAMVSERPADATQICAIVAEPNHEIIPDSGTCIDLPALAPTDTSAPNAPPPTKKPAGPPGY